MRDVAVRSDENARPLGRDKFCRATSAEVIKQSATQLAGGGFPRIAEIFGAGRIDPDKNRFGQGLRILLDRGEWSQKTQ